MNFGLIITDISEIINLSENRNEYKKKENQTKNANNLKHRFTEEFFFTLMQ